MNFIQKKDRAIVFLLPEDLNKAIPGELLSQVKDAPGQVEVRYSGAEDLSLSGLSELMYMAAQIRLQGKRVELTAPGGVVDNIRICALDSSFDGVRVG